MQGSIEIARALVPGLKQIVLVGDPLEKQPFRRHFQAELAQAAPELVLKDLTGLPFAEVKKQVAALPNNSAILYTAITNDGAGTTYVPQEAGEVVAAAANRPVVVDLDNRIGRGGTGGAVVQPAVIGEEAAQLVLRIFAGGDASRIPLDVSASIKPVFDSRELIRWGISDAQLPPGSEVRFLSRRRGNDIAHKGSLFFSRCYSRRRSSSRCCTRIAGAGQRKRAVLELSGDLAHVNRVATAGELAASIAHEIRQPLAAIVARGSAGLNWLKKAPPDIDKVRDALENIVNNGHRADQVLRNTRAMFGKGDTSQETFNVNKVVDEVLALVGNRISEERVQLIKKYGEMPLPAVRANRIELQQVLLNLIMNAIEAMSMMSGGDRVLKLTTEVTRTGRVLIAVQDSGPGIAVDQLDLIFKSFFTTKPGGMGVGLSISRTIVEAHGGQLTVARGDPVGMVFTIDLPLRVRRQQAANNHKPAAELQHSSPDR